MKSSFFQLPRALFEGAYVDLSSDGKLLYTLLLNRRSLSEKNNFTDSMGNTVVYFTNKEVCDKIGCSHDKATKLLRELEGFNLISRHKQGRGRPDIIYVRYIPICEEKVPKDSDIQESGMKVSVYGESGKPAWNNIDDSHINQSFSYEETELVIKEQIEYDIISERGYGMVLDEIVNLITETYCSEEQFVRIAKRQISTQTFRARILKMTAEHVEHVLEFLEKNKGKIKNMRAYLLTALYYSIDTLEAGCLYGN